MKTYTISMDGFEIDAETATEAAREFRSWVKNGLLEDPVIDVQELTDDDSAPVIIFNLANFGE